MSGPTPAATMSFGRALLNTPTRARSRVYQAGRMIARRSVAISVPRPTRTPMSTSASEPTRRAQCDQDHHDEDRRRNPEHGLQPGAHGARDHPPAGEVDVAAARVDDAGEDVEERRLARAVRPDQADDRAPRDLEVGLADGDEAAEALRDAMGAQQDVARGRLDLDAEGGRLQRFGLLHPFGLLGRDAPRHPGRRRPPPGRAPRALRASRGPGEGIVGHSQHRRRQLTALEGIRPLDVAGRRAAPRRGAPRVACDSGRGPRAAAASSRQAPGRTGRTGTA